MAVLGNALAVLLMLAAVYLAFAEYSQLIVLGVMLLSAIMLIGCDAGREGWRRRLTSACGVAVGAGLYRYFVKGESLLQSTQASAFILLFCIVVNLLIGAAYRAIFRRSRDSSDGGRPIENG